MRRTSTVLRTTSLLVLGCFATACGGGGGGGQSPPPPPPGGGGWPTDSLNRVDLDSDGDGDMIVDVPSTVDPLITALFARYTALIAPNGARVHLLSQAGVDDAKLRRAREILRQHLTDVADSREGADKADVANMMTTRSATLQLFRDAASGDPSEPAIAAFVAAMKGSVLPLLADRIVLEGSDDYMAALPAEDNTFGVTGALVYRLGLRFARPQFAAELMTLLQAEMAGGDFTAPVGAPVSEHDDAFVAVALDVHSGVFGHGPRPDGRGGNEYLYAFDTRDEMAAADPWLHAWIEAFFAPVHLYDAEVVSTFTGTFDCLLEVTNPYSYRAQYLRNVALTGTRECSLFGGSGDDELRGNNGANLLMGRAGNDTLVGGLGVDTAVYNYPRASYEITYDGNKVVVEDVHGGYEGRDVLTGIERVRFADNAFDL